MEETTAVTGIDSIIETVTTGVSGVFEMSKSAFQFIAGNPLCLFMMSAGFAGYAMSMVRRALRTAKRS